MSEQIGALDDWITQEPESPNPVSLPLRECEIDALVRVLAEEVPGGCPKAADKELFRAIVIQLLRLLGFTQIELNEREKEAFRVATRDRAADARYEEMQDSRRP